MQTSLDLDGRNLGHLQNDWQANGMKLQFDTVSKTYEHIISIMGGEPYLCFHARAHFGGIAGICVIYEILVMINGPNEGIT